MPTLCRLLAGLVLVGSVLWLGLCAHAVWSIPPERTLFAAFGAAWLPVAAFAGRRVSVRLPRARRAGWGLTAVVPAGCAGWIAWQSGVAGLPPAGYAILGFWAVVQLAGVVGAVLDGAPRPAAAWQDDEEE